MKHDCSKPSQRRFDAALVLCANKDMVMAANVAENPYVFESEVLSPFARLEPGQAYTWHYDWFATHIGGDYPVVGCNSVGVIAQPLWAKRESGRVLLRGRFGVFTPGAAHAEFYDAAGKSLESRSLALPAHPHQALVIDTAVPSPQATASVRLVLVDVDGKPVGALARCTLQRE